VPPERARGGLDRNLDCRGVTGYGARLRMTEDGEQNQGTGFWNKRKDVKGVTAVADPNSDCRRTPSPPKVPRFGRCASWSPARVPGECPSGASPPTVHSPAADAAFATQHECSPGARLGGESVLGCGASGGATGEPTVWHGATAFPSAPLFQACVRKSRTGAMMMR
jgi:hypothetical protein